MRPRLRLRQNPITSCLRQCVLATGATGDSVLPSSSRFRRNRRGARDGRSGPVVAALPLACFQHVPKDTERNCTRAASLVALCAMSPFVRRSPSAQFSRRLAYGSWPCPERLATPFGEGPDRPVAATCRTANTLQIVRHGHLPVSAWKARAPRPQPGRCRCLLNRRLLKDKGPKCH